MGCTQGRVPLRLHLQYSSPSTANFALDGLGAGCAASGKHNRWVGKAAARVVAHGDNARRRRTGAAQGAMLAQSSHAWAYNLATQLGTIRSRRVPNGRVPPPAAQDRGVCMGWVRQSIVSRGVDGEVGFRMETRVDEQLTQPGGLGGLLCSSGWCDVMWPGIASCGAAPTQSSSALAKHLVRRPLAMPMNEPRLPGLRAAASAA